MDYYAAFEISKSGLAVEKLRMDLVALNIANANSIASNPSGVSRPLKVYSAPKMNLTAPFSFESYLGLQQQMGVEVLSINEMQGSARKIYEPKNPYADQNGFIYRSDINPASEMIEMINALRSYQANIKAITAAKTMAEEALKIAR